MKQKKRCRNCKNWSPSHDFKPKHGTCIGNAYLKVTNRKSCCSRWEQASCGDCIHCYAIDGDAEHYDGLCLYGAAITKLPGGNQMITAADCQTSIGQPACNHYRPRCVVMRNIPAAPPIPLYTGQVTDYDD